MKKNIRSVLAIILLYPAILANTYAESVPRSTNTDKRIKYVNYQDNQVVSIRATDFINTQIIFSEDEKIVNVQGGDDSAWTYHIFKLVPNVLNIKPTLPKSNTNLDVITFDSKNKQKIYRFQLVNSEEGLGLNNTTYAIKFNYPEINNLNRSLLDNMKQIQKSAIANSKMHPDDFNWYYSFSGDKRLIPSQIFDDGKFTYLKLRKNQKVPSVFSVDNPQGIESSVNIRKTDNYIIIQSVSPQLTLRNGRYLVSSIFNNKLIKKQNNLLGDN